LRLFERKRARFPLLDKGAVAMIIFPKITSYLKLIAKEVGYREMFY
jgi:hypothetical protein